MTNPQWQPAPWPPHQSQQPSMLAAHSDRERAVDVLRAGFAEGRLQQPEYEKRVERAYQARTVAELSTLVADLPQGPTPQQQMPMAHVPQTFRPMPPAPTNGKAIGALACGVGTFFSGGITAIPAVILGHMARGEIRRTREQGDGMAVGGLVLGWLWIGLWAFILVIALLASAGSS
ncbi:MULTISPECIES: DUF1707 and DUF4190 domain-containing protein [unclassified Streptomyces]|uniref:DUF1707 and DUF4190 domain-containing protein n=1 Tax=unclassified Streptomyces TaxID=2593676 RepID=UPI000372C142|nr:DUF1707 and DUF4190 domain-containing protein [Streptomyces sp. HmicA12]